MDQLFAILFAEPSALLKTGMRLTHFLGLILGLGAATVLDLVILRFVVAGTIMREHAALITFCSKIVTLGLALLWASGFAFLAHYVAFDIDKLWNPKIWAKVTIVGVLTLNGVCIHRIVLPLIWARVGHNLFDGLDHWRRTLLLTFGTVSAISWYVPLLLGTVSQLNYVVPATTILLGYAALLCMAIVAAQALMRLLLREGAEPVSRAQYDALVRRFDLLLAQYPAVSNAFSLRSNALVGAGATTAVFACLAVLIGWPNSLQRNTAAPAANTQAVDPQPTGFVAITGAPILVPQPASMLALAEPASPRPEPPPATGLHHPNETPEQTAVLIEPTGSDQAAPLTPAAHAVSQEPNATEAPVRDPQNKADAQIIQQRLADLGYLAAPATGLWGPLSRTALRAFKRLHYLPNDGEWNVATERMLFNSAGKEPPSFVGTWAADASACSARRHHNGSLAAAIDEHGARAGEVSCAFERLKRTGAEWTMVAICSNRVSRWTSSVRLAVSGNRLHWSSERGAQQYVRCQRPSILAQVSR